MGDRPGSVRVRWQRTLLLVITLAALVGCSSLYSKAGAPSPTAQVTAVPRVVVAFTATPVLPSPTVVPSPTVARTPPRPAPSATPVATATPLAAPSVLAGARPADPVVEAAIKAVIARGNDEQVQAFRQHDPTLMRDTSTAAYYQQMVRTNSDLATGGIWSIKLVKLEWGPVLVNGAGVAQATTYETWDTVFTDGTLDEDRERNVYTLVQESGAWKVADDAHPDEGVNPLPGVISSQTPSPTTRPPKPNAPAGRGKSYNWSGYAALSGTFTAVEGTWTVPRPTGGRTIASGATWVGIGGVRHRDLIQAGTEELVLGPEHVRYSAWVELLPGPSHTVRLVVHPGDSVTVSLIEQASDRWLVSLHNNSTGESYQATLTYQSSLSSAEWVEEAPSGRRGIVPLENFGTVKIGDAIVTEGGKQVTAAEAGAAPVTMVDRLGQPLAVPSKLGADGKSFSVTRTQVSE